MLSESIWGREGREGERKDYGRTVGEGRREEDRGDQEEKKVLRQIEWQRRKEGRDALLS